MRYQSILLAWPHIHRRSEACRESADPDTARKVILQMRDAGVEQLVALMDRLALIIINSFFVHSFI